VERSEWFSGHEPIQKRPNVRKEIARLRRDPLEQFLLAAGFDGFTMLSNDLTRYHEAYRFHYLAMRRYLENMSVVARFRNGPHYTLKHGGKYTQSERKLAEQFRPLRPYLEFDLANCLLHTRILLDRVAGLSRYFLKLRERPSFTSFADHKKFFERRQGGLGEHEAYAEYLRSQTAWFEVPLKQVRDKFLVHAAQSHMRMLGITQASDVHLSIHLPQDPTADKPYRRSKVIFFSPLQMSRQVHDFLVWFNAYGTAALATR
jgi:hypothetical protein